MQIYVTRLRQLLGTTGLIQSRLEGYVIAVTPGDVDIGRFELLLERARAAADSSDRHREAESLRELGETLRKLGRLDQARAYRREAMATFERLQPTDAGQVRALLAELPGQTPAKSR